MASETYAEVMYRDASGRSRTKVITIPPFGWTYHDEQGQLVITKGEGIELIVGRDALIAFRPNLRSLDEVESVIVGEDGALYEKVDATAAGDAGCHFIPGLRVDKDTVNR